MVAPRVVRNSTIGAGVDSSLQISHWTITLSSLLLDQPLLFCPSSVLSSCLNLNCKSSDSSPSIFFIATSMNLVYSNASTKKQSLVKWKKSTSSHMTPCGMKVDTYPPPPRLSSSRASMSLIANSYDHSFILNSTIFVSTMDEDATLLM